MIAGLACRLLGTPDLRLRQAAMPLLLLAASLAAYILLHWILLTIAVGSAVECAALDGVAFAAAWLLSNIRYAEIPPLLRPLLRIIGGMVLMQVAFDGLALLYGPAGMVTGQNGLFFDLGTVLAVAAGSLALWRPGFLLPLFFHYVAFRYQLDRVTRVAVSETDYLSMLDIGLFVAVGTLATVLLTRPRLSRLLLPDDLDAGWLRTKACALIWAWAVGAHLGNYFVSGWTKIRAGGGDPLFWLLHNPTQTSILIGLERGDNPLAAWPWLVQGSWNAIAGAGIMLNLIVLGSQLAAPLAVTHRRLLMAFTLLFDLFHVAVYLTLGAAFFFWVAVNVAIFLSARRINDKELTPAMTITAIVAVMTAHLAFYTSHLGWLDGAKLASPSFVAETRDGRTVPIPSVYFGILSYSIAQTAMYIPDDHFPMRLGGNSYNPADWREAQSCGPEIRHRQDTGVTLQTVESMVRETDAAMRRHPIVKQANLYYFYPHHMVANPLMFESFERLSIDDIVGYRYVVDSVCLSLRDGRLVRDVRKRTESVIDVAR